jgi:hypothetical protein
MTPWTRVQRGGACCISHAARAAIHQHFMRRVTWYRASGEECKSQCILPAWPSRRGKAHAGQACAPDLAIRCPPAGSLPETGPEPYPATPDFAAGHVVKKRRRGISPDPVTSDGLSRRQAGATASRPDAEPAEPSRSQPSTLLGKVCTQPLQAYIVAGESCEAARAALYKSSALMQTEGWAARPSSWTERRISVVEPDSRSAGMTRTRYDKAFCVEWIGNDKAAVSTKCGHVLRVDRKSRTIQEVDLEGARWVEPPIVTEDDLHRFRVDRGGIHCIKANKSQNLLACSGGRCENHHVYVLNLKSEKWATVRRGLGHSDWAFTLSWIADSTFVTGSRDKTVRLWSPHLSASYEMHPVATYEGIHTTKACPDALDIKF